MKKYFAFLLCWIMVGLCVASCNKSATPDPCIANPQPGCPNYVDPCETDPQPGCPNYVDPCEADPQPGCPNYVDPCETDPQPGCPNYVDPDTPVFGNSITIGTTEYAIDEKKVEKVADGLWYVSAQVKNAAKPLIIHSLRYTTSTTGYSIETWVGNDSISGKETPSTMINRYEQSGRQVKAAINGGFYGTEVGGTPITTEVINGVMTFPPAGNFPIIGFDGQNLPYMDFVQMTSSVKIEKDDSELDISSVNGTRWADYLVLYNSYKGKRTGTNEWGTEVLCYPTTAQWEKLGSHVNVRCKVDKIERSGGKGSMEIPQGRIVLSGHGIANTFLNVLQVGDYLNVTVDFSLKSDPSITSTTIRNVVSGWNIILSNNNVMDFFNNEGGLESNNHPRTAVGYSADKNYVYFTIVEGRNPTQANPTISAGVSTKELAQVMQYLGAANAINLDGGGSSCMVVDKKAVNFLSDPGNVQRAVADGLAIIKK